MKQDELVPLLTTINSSILHEDSPDVSMIACRHNPDLTLVSSTDFFTPVSQNPYNQGRIAIANVLSDLYAVGVVDIDSVLMILTLSTTMPRESRDIVTREMIRGFIEGCELAGTRCTGGQTVHNPWTLIGGTASSIVPTAKLVRPDNLQPGDILILTKPLGTQICGNLALWMLDDTRWSTKVSHLIDEATAVRAVAVGEESMMRLNLTAARVMLEIGAHGATDVTGFGILGHAKNLAQVQKNDVDIVITALPVIRGLLALESSVTVDYGLSKGTSAETSGGLLIAIPEALETEFRTRMINAGEPDVWRVGHVEHGGKTARILPKEELLILEV